VKERWPETDRTRTRVNVNAAYLLKTSVGQQVERRIYIVLCGAEYKLHLALLVVVITLLGRLRESDIIISSMEAIITKQGMKG